MSEKVYLDESGNELPAGQYSQNVEYVPKKAFVPSAPEQALGSAFRGLQSAIAAPLSGVEAVARWAPAKLGFSPFGLNDDPTKSLADYAKNAWEQRYKGARAVGDNPLNLLSLALPAAKVPALLGIEAPLAKASTQVLGEAALGAGGGALQAMAHPEEGVTPMEGAKLGGLVAGGTSALGAGLQAGGKSLFPGLSARMNPKVTPQQKEMVAKNLDQILSAGALPKGKEGFIGVAEDIRDAAGKRYQLAEQAVPSEWAQPTSDLQKSAMQILKDRLGGLRRAGLEFDAATGQPVVPADATSAMSGKFSNIRGTQAYQGQDPEWLNIAQLGSLKTALTDPVLHENPVGATKQMLKDVSGAFHEALTDAQMAAPGYAQALGPDAAKQYALSKALQKVVAYPGPLGLGHRLPFGTAVSPWYLSSAAYKGGKALERAALPLVSLAGYKMPGYDTTQPAMTP